MWTKISQALSTSLGQHHNLTQIIPISGGSINAAYKACSNTRCFFVKLNHLENLKMFLAEEAGLNELAASTDFHIPRPLCTGQTQQHAFIVMEFVSLFPAKNTSSSAQMGEKLAKMHSEKRDFFGWHSNNTIGSTLQMNLRHADWITFWRSERLGFQLTLAKDKALPIQLFNKGQKILEEIDCFYRDYRPHPSLLHGDLWNGNVGFNDEGRPVLFDPAVYYGDRETDLAMTELFGGFDSAFYDAYQSTYTLESGYPLRKHLYNLYHLLNHFNLFGESYLSQISATMNRLLAEIEY